MENLLRERIRARLTDLDLNPFEAARRIPAERTFLNDLLIGKKQTIRAKVIPHVAALDCDPGYLMGTQDAPRGGIPPQAPEIRPQGAPGIVPLVGIAEVGAWRPAAFSGPPRPLPFATDPRFPAEGQAAYLVRGDHAEALGVADGSVILALTGAPYRDGDVVVVLRTRQGEDGPEAEVSIRRVDGKQLVLGLDARPLNSDAPGVQIVARAISVHRVF